MKRSWKPYSKRSSTVSSSAWAAIALAVCIVSWAAAPVAASAPARAQNGFVRPAPGKPASFTAGPTRKVEATGCSSNYSNAADYFIGIGGNANVAGGAESAVLAGAANEACFAYAAIGGGDGNVIALSSGPISASFIGSGYDNQILGAYSFIGAGMFGSAQGTGSFVGSGGEEYYAQSGGPTPGMGDTATGIDSFVGSGDLNSAAGNGGFVGGGGFTYASGHATAYGNQANGADAFVGAGDQNVAAGNESVIGGGNLNSITAAGADGAIAGGNGNYVSGVYGAIGGGSGNKAEGAFAVIPGGADDEALGAASFAAGYHAEAAHAGSFVWSDDTSGSKLVADGAANEFVVRASGGTFVYSSENLSTGVTLAAGSGTWASLSDRNAKTNFAALDDGSVLAKLDRLPVGTWSYKSESGVKHVGPMAQDFYAAFGVGEDDRHITSIDEDGVALAAIKALHAENGRLHGENVRMKANFAALAAKNADLERRFDALVARLRR